MKNALLFVLAAVLFLLFSTVSATSDEAGRTRAALDSARRDMADMASHNLSTTRYGDTLSIAEQLYEAQLALETDGGEPNYILVKEKIDELAELKMLAYRTLDELAALETSLNQTSVTDLGPALTLYAQARGEFEVERYEESLKRIDQAYAKISELEALQTKVKAFYEATSRTVANFLSENWRMIVGAIAVVAIVAILGYGWFTRLIIKRKIMDLELRKESVRGLMADAQKEFFERGETSEASYQIKMKKYGELLRDINRQIPLLNEELAMLEKNTLRGHKE